MSHINLLGNLVGNIYARNFLFAWHNNMLKPSGDFPLRPVTGHADNVIIESC